MLEIALGGFFEPEQHWTSPRRERAGQGLSCFSGNEESHATFTIPDQKGIVTRYLIEIGCDEAREWLSSPPVYHLEVKGSKHGLGSRFAMSNGQLRRVSHLGGPALALAGNERCP